MVQSQQAALLTWLGVTVCAWYRALGATGYYSSLPG